MKTFDDQLGASAFSLFTESHGKARARKSVSAKTHKRLEARVEEEGAEHMFCVLCEDAFIKGGKLAWSENKSLL